MPGSVKIHKVITFFLFFYLFVCLFLRLPLLYQPPLSILLGSLCWETTVGQELFKLTIIDLVALVFSVLTGDLFVSLTVRFLNCFQGRLMDLEKVVSFKHIPYIRTWISTIYCIAFTKNFTNETLVFPPVRLS